jgi:hypothetical protein
MLIYPKGTKGDDFLNYEAASAILTEGTAISTKCGSNMAWHRNIVYKSEGNLVYLALIEQYIENIISLGATISLKFFDEYFIYLFEGVVSAINAEHPGYIIVRITNAEEILNSRLSPRYDVNLAASLKPSWDDTVYFSVISDISFGGIAFMCDHKFDYNEELDISIYLTPTEVLSAKGKVVRKIVKSSVIDYSMQFIEIDEYNCTILSRYFSSIEEEISAMHQQFLTSVKGKL